MTAIWIIEIGHFFMSPSRLLDLHQDHYMDVSRHVSESF